MDKEKIIQQLKDLKQVKPEKDWVNSQRQLLMSQITRQSSAKSRSFVYNFWLFFKSLLPVGFLRFVAKPVGVLTILSLLVFTTGMLGVNASKGSLPGEFLYSVKLTSEKIKVGFTSGEEKKAEMHMRFAEKRIREIEKVAAEEKEPEEKKEKIKVAVGSLEEEMKKTRQALNKVKYDVNDSDEEIMKSVMDMDQKIDKIGRNVGQKAKDFAAEDKEIAQNLEQAVEAVEETGVEAIAIVVKKHKNGQIDFSENELVESIEEKINKSEQKNNQVAERLKQTLTDLEKLQVKKQEQKTQVVELDKKENSELTEKSALSITPVEEEEKSGSLSITPVEEEQSENETETSSETLADQEQSAEETAQTEREDQVESSEKEWGEAVIRIEKIRDEPNKITERLQEAKELLNQGDLSQSLQIIKESNNAIQQIKASVDKIEELIQKEQAEINTEQTEEEQDSDSQNTEQAEATEIDQETVETDLNQ